MNIEPTATQKMKLGFLGVGWIGRSRLKAVANSELAEIFAIADTEVETAKEAGKIAPGANFYNSIDEMAAAGVEGLVIATPSAQHAGQAVKALESGIPVFCQKPLGRNAAETRKVVEAARQNNLLLGVDLSYRYTHGMQQIKQLVQDGRLGHIYAAELTFHNAYGPDKSWFYDPQLSGGGCLMDLGVHLVDLALWVLDFPELKGHCSKLFTKGRPLGNREKEVEDYATAQLSLDSGQVVDISCSWNLHAGKEAIIKAAFYGTGGGVVFNNVNGSFYDFNTFLNNGTSSEVISAPPDDWFGKAAVVWADRLAKDRTFNPEAEQYIKVAEVLDKLYQ